MTDVAPETTRGLNRRTLLRNGLITGLGAAVATVAVPALTGVAKAAVNDFAIPPAGGDALQFNAQQNWWFCSQCSALFASDSSGSPTGACLGGPLGDTKHSSSGSWEYEVPYANPATTNLQLNWNWCSACATLFFRPNQANSICVGNTTINPLELRGHTLGTWIYDLMYNGWTGAGPALQPNWTWCSQCQELWHPSGGNVCPVSFKTNKRVGHTVGSNWNYQVFTPQTR
jgi:hypothetical protein